MTVVLHSTDFAVVESGMSKLTNALRYALASYREGHLDPRDIFCDDGGNELEWVVKFKAEHGRLPSFHDAIAYDLKQVREFFEYNFKEMQRVAEHQCEFPPLEDVGDSARVCSICGCNGDV